jgi:protein SCO1/2/putative membrane protein
MSFARIRRVPLALLLLVCLSGAGLIDDDYGAVGDFALTERSGQTVRNSDLLGKVWIASFQFTRCSGGCPQISKTMQRLQDDLAGYPDVLLVTFTVDPEHDDAEELSRYAEAFGADPQRWLFLTGPQSAIYELLDKSFHLPAQQNEGTARTPGNEVMHSSKLVLVDRRGRIRGYFEGMPDRRLPNDDMEYEANIKKLETKAVALLHDTWYLPSDFPRFNATLNAISAMLLVLGFTAIRRRLVRLHVVCMLSALCVSALFLAAYLYYHLVIKHGQATSFAAQTSHAHPPAWVGTVYLAVLLTHTVLAAVITPLALYTAYQGLRGRLSRHVRIARWTLPIWLYVSISGVAVYWMLYQLYPPP